MGSPSYIGLTIKKAKNINVFFLFQPIQFRESNFTDIPKIQLWAMAPCFKGDQKQLFRLALMYETARFVTRDIGM